MMVLSAGLTAVFLSPLLFILLLAAAISLVALGKKKAALPLLAGTLFCFLALSTAPVEDLLLRPLEKRYPAFPSAAPRVDAVVVLGGGVVDGAPDQGGQPSLSEESFKRVAYGFMLSREIGASVIVSGGRVWKKAGPTEAEVAAAALVRLGMPASHVVMESRSRTTWENAREVGALLSARGAHRVALVTSAYHMPRAMLAFTRAGISCVPAPTDFKSQYGPRTFLEILPRFETLADSFKAVREYLGLVQYELRR